MDRCESATPFGYKTLNEYDYLGVIQHRDLDPKMEITMALDDG